MMFVQTEKGTAVNLAYVTSITKWKDTSDRESAQYGKWEVSLHLAQGMTGTIIPYMSDLTAGKADAAIRWLMDKANDPQ